MSEAAKHLSGETLSRLLLLVKSHTGITMEERKRELLFARIRRRLRVLGLETPEQYIEFLESSEAECQEFINAVTTNETLFFRTPLVWEYFKTEFLPDWYAKNPEGTMRVWSAASSSGEEAHSIAMLCEEFKTTHPNFKYRVYGSDISTEVLAEARSGIFKSKNITELKNKFPDFFAKYFKALPDGNFKAHEIITNNIEFSVHNLHHRAPKSHFYDIVFLRNVLIYFNDKDQELVLHNAHGAIKPGGMLIVGESESLSRLKTEFSFKKPLIYSKAAA